MSELEGFLLMQLRIARAPTPEREYRFAPPRRYRFDLAFPAQRIGIECEGGTWTQGRHVRPGGYAKDCEKYNLAALDGWMVLRFTGEMIDDGSALRLIERALEQARPVVVKGVKGEA